MEVLGALLALLVTMFAPVEQAGRFDDCEAVMVPLGFETYRVVVVCKE